MTKEQRADGRRAVRTETLICVEQRGTMAVTRDISGTGLFVETTDGVGVGEKVQLFIQHPRESAIFRVHAEVVRSLPGEGFGARFISRTSRADLDRFVARL